MTQLWNIVGHRPQLQRLEREVEDGNVAHAYLFAGPRQIGKAAVARAFAAFLQCPQGFCRQCRDCQGVAAGTHSDLTLLEENDESIGIDEVRELSRKTHLTRQSRYRLLVIEALERMPTEAQNAFLKTLEEPPAGTVFLLTTHHLDRILPTIQSRVRHLAFSTVAEGDLAAHVRREFAGRPALEEILAWAQGKPGLAFSLLRDPALLERHRAMEAQIEGFLRRNDLSHKFQWAEALEKEEGGIELFLDTFARLLRKRLFQSFDSPVSAPQSRFNMQELANLVEFLEKTRYRIERNANKKLALENLLLLTEKG